MVSQTENRVGWKKMIERKVEMSVVITISMKWKMENMTPDYSSDFRCHKVAGHNCSDSTFVSTFWRGELTNFDFPVQE